MSITAKELAKKLNLSAAAVSMALNNKNGVSTETRQRVWRAAEELGFDFSTLSRKGPEKGCIYFIYYKEHNAIMHYSHIGLEIINGAQTECKNAGYRSKSLCIHQPLDNIDRIFEDLRASDCSGIIICGTEMSQPALEKFLPLGLPLVLLDNAYLATFCNCITIHNVQGAYQAARYLITRTGRQPGYLASSYRIVNFIERKSGFNQALREYGLSTACCITHSLSPNIEGAKADMLALIDEGVPLASAYFAEDDIIALGAMQALKLRGYRIPEDIAIIGFDNIPEAATADPPLTTVDVPRNYLGRLAVQNLIQQIETPFPYFTKTEVSTHLVERSSV